MFFNILKMFLELFLSVCLTSYGTCLPHSPITLLQKYVVFKQSKRDQILSAGHVTWPSCERILSLYVGSASSDLMNQTQLKCYIIIFISMEYRVIVFIGLCFIAVCFHTLFNPNAALDLHVLPHSQHPCLPLAPLFCFKV